MATENKTSRQPQLETTDLKITDGLPAESVGTFYKVMVDAQFSFDIVNPATPFDWSATYFQFSPAHALCYAHDKVPRNGGDVICLTAFRFKPGVKLRVVRIEDTRFALGSLSGAEKADMTKKALGIPAETKLIQGLNGALIVKDNSEDWELVISHARVISEFIEHRDLAQLRIRDHQITHYRVLPSGGDAKDPELPAWIPMSVAEQLAPDKLAPRIPDVPSW